MNLLGEWQFDVSDVWAGAPKEWCRVAPEQYYRQQVRITTEEGWIRPARQMCRAPLADITTNRMNVTRISEDMSANEKEWLGWTKGAKIRAALADGASRKRTYVGRYMEQDEQQLRQWGVIRTATRKPTFIMPVFKVPKEQKARLIVDCRELNHQLPRPGDMGLPNLHDVLDDMSKCKWIAQFDGRSYFYQIPLDEEAQDLFGVKLAGARGKFETYALQVLPMGFSYAPGVAQAISNLVLRKVKEAHPGVTAHAWVDNFLLGADTREALEGAIRSFQARCERYAIELKPNPEPIVQSMEVLGVHLDVSGDATIAIGSKMRAKLEGMTAKEGDKWTPRAAYELVGALLWVHWSVWRTPLATQEHLIRAISVVATEVAATGKWDGKLTSVKQEELLGSIDAALRAPAASGGGPAVRASTVVWTDASQQALGYVVSNHLGQIGARERGPDADIFQRELWAAARALVLLSNRGGGTVVIDNKPAFHALVRGHSTSPMANAVLRNMVERAGGHPVELAWTESANQAADDISRGGVSTDAKPGPWQVRLLQRWRK